MAENTIDILMRVVPKQGAALKTRNLTDFAELDADDSLSKDFKSGYMSELIDFSFSAGIETSLESREKKKQKAESLKNEMTGKSAPKPVMSHQETVQMIRDQQEKTVKKRAEKAQLDMQPVDFTRVMDSSSIEMMKLLTTSAPVAKLSIVKRKAAGVANSGLCYLRLDFEHCLLTRLDWKDQQQVVHESGTFIYRQLTISYRPQLPSGLLGDPISQKWVMNKA